VLRLAGGERAIKDEHFELFTIVETPKMAEIQRFQFFSAISQKKWNISETVRVTEILQETKNVQNDFLHRVDKVYTDLEPSKCSHNRQKFSSKFNYFCFIF